MVLTRENYIKSISDNLALFQKSIEFRTELNMYDLNINAENFVRDLLNIIFNYSLENLNFTNPNQIGIDLGDTINKIAVQVTSTTNRKKVISTIDKFIKGKLYEKYSYLYVFVLKDKQQKYKKFDTYGCFDFHEIDNIIDIKSLLKRIQDLELAKLEELHTFVDREISNPKKEKTKIRDLDGIGCIPNKLQIYEHQPFTAFYINFHKLLGISATYGIPCNNIFAKSLNEQESIRGLSYYDYHELMKFTNELLHCWKPKVLNLGNPSNLTKNYVGSIFEFFQTDFKSKNIKFWNRYRAKPEMFGIVNKDPYLYSEVDNVKIVLPLNLAWMTTDTSYHSFGLDTGRADGLSGLCILKSITQYTEHREAFFSPLVIGIYDLCELIYEERPTRRTIQIRQLW